MALSLMNYLSLLLELKDKKIKNNVKTVCANYKVVIKHLLEKKDKDEKES